MARRRRSEGGEGLSAWPGYVDALSTLLMVVIFVLLVFVLAQAFLSVALSGRDKALDRAGRQLAELSDMLSLERGRTQELRAGLAQLTSDLKAATDARDGLLAQLGALRGTQARTEAERDALKGERDGLAARLADAQAQARAAQGRIAQLQAAGEDAARRTDTTAQAAATTEAALIAARRSLAQREADLAAREAELAARQTDLAAARQALAELNQTASVDRATLAVKLADLARMAEENRALAALRDELEAQAKAAAAKTLTEEQAKVAVAAQLADERKLGESARAQIALLNRQLDEVRGQLATLAKALEASEASARDKDVQIVNLGSRLNAALAQKVEELQSYRSEFFGRLRTVLAGRPGIQVVGDRFVFQSEVLFPTGSADLSQGGIEELFRLADTLREIIKAIPADVPWILRVDGHADRQPISGRFASNWELSAGRAINVVKLLSIAGIPANHLAATAFGDTQPIDNGETPDAFAKNRRIEFRLTDR